MLVLQIAHIELIFNSNKFNERKTVKESLKINLPFQLFNRRQENVDNPNQRQK